jgi:uncharacterized membrane protein YdbT with pleckstrin-like domain
MEQKQRLGIRVFYYYLSKKILVGLVLFVVSLICLSLKDSVLIKVLFMFPGATASNLMGSFINILFIVSFLFLIGGMVLAWIKYLSCTFTFGDVAFNIERGILSKKEIAIPYRQIQNVNIEQSFSHRLMGVSKLIIQTAGDDDNEKEGEASGVFDVIDSRIAEETRNILLQKANVQTFKEVKTEA